MENVSAIDYLEKEFERRKNQNPSYSLRAYAKNLGVSPAVLSQVLGRKKDLTPKVLIQMAPKLNLQNDKLEEFLRMLNKLKKEKNIKSVEKSNMKKIDMETFNVISEWHHFVILEMFYLDDFKNDPAWMATKLKIPEKKIKQAIENLKTVRLLEVENGELVPTDDYTLIDEYHYTSQAMRERQKQLLELSSSKIDLFGTDLRDHSSITITVDPDLIPEIKEKIKVFRRSLGNFIAKTGKQNTAVYEIQISFFPVTDI